MKTKDEHVHSVDALTLLALVVGSKIDPHNTNKLQNTFMVVGAFIEMQFFFSNVKGY